MATNPQNQLTAAAGEIAKTIFYIDEKTFRTPVHELERIISTNPTLVAMAKENEYLKSIISGNAETEIRQLQTKCTELQAQIESRNARIEQIELKSQHHSELLTARIEELVKRRRFRSLRKTS